MTVAISYLRVSGLGQVEKDGFPRQRERVEMLAKECEWEIVEEYKEEGKSGKAEGDDFLERPKLAALLHDLKERKHGEHVVVLIERLDRLARDILVQELFIREVQKLGAEIRSAGDAGCLETTPDESTNATRVLLRQILGSIAEYDRKMIVLRLRGARVRKREENLRLTGVAKCEGSKLFGMHPKKPEEVACLKRMQTLEAKGRSIRRIGEVLTREGFKPRSGQQWNPGTIYKILKRNGVKNGKK